MEKEKDKDISRLVCLPYNTEPGRYGTALKEIKAIHYCIKMLGDRITLEESDRVSGKNTI